MLSDFWNVWIIVITLASIAGCGLLIIYTSHGQPKVDADNAPSTGHEYDGIEELENPLPRWWVMMFWMTIVFGLGYMVLYGYGNYDGVLTVEVDGKPVTWTSANQWKAEVQAFDAKVAPIFAKYSSTPIEDLAKDEEALQTGHRLFKSYCSVCHGTNAQGAMGFPNLTDNDWLYGGKPENIKQTITLGRQGVMAPHIDILGGKEGVENMAQYVRSLSGLKHDAKAAAKAEPQFQQICFACHGMEGKGNHLLGAPDLTNNIWLYGGSTKDIEFTLTHGRNGVMPAQQQKLGDDKIHVLTAYIYSLSNKK